MTLVAEVLLWDTVYMKKLNQLISLFLGVVFFIASSAPLSAQEFVLPGLRAVPAQKTAAPLSTQKFILPGLRAAKKTSAAEDFLRALRQSAFVRRPDMTAQKLIEQAAFQGRMDGQMLAAVLSDDAYIASLDSDTAAELAYYAQFADSRDGSFSWTDQLTRVVLGRLGDYNENAADFPLQAFYAAVAVSLGHNPYMSRAVENWAFEQINTAANPMDTARRGWAAAVLADLAVESADDVWSAARRERFEWRLEKLIRKFDWLQNARTDYKMTGVKNVLGATNQGTLIQLFAQANSFFAMKDDDGFVKQMVSAGGLNPVGRALAGKEQGDRFSNTGENFYLHAPTPGTDGKGHFADSVNGRRHFILASLMQALFLSYNTRPRQESSALMQQFVRGYLTVNADGHFVHYLYIPLSGMRLGTAIHYATSLDGWDKEEAALQKELYAKLKKGYPWDVACTGVQGACEVAAEWLALGKVFGWVFRGIGWGGKAVGRQAVKAMSPRALMNLALIQIAARQGKKAVITWSKQTVKSLLKGAGWKATAVIGTGAAVRGDSPRRKTARIPAR